MDARVAIVLRTRDRPVLLARALAGILAQTHADWHLVLVNDGGGHEPVAALAASYDTAFGDRLTLLHVAEPRGPDGAAALGLEQPAVREAGFVALHDDDDAWQPDYLQAGLAMLAGRDGGAYVGVASHGWQIDERMEEGGVVEQARRPGFAGTHPLELAGLLRGDDVPLICLLMRRPVLDRIGEAADAAGRSPAYGAGLATALLLEGDVAVLPRRLAFSYSRMERTGSYANLSLRPDHQASIRGTVERNAMLRRLAASDAALPGLVPALAEALSADFDTVLQRVDRNGGWGHGRHVDLQSRLVRIEAVLETLRRRSRPFGRSSELMRGLARHGWHALGPPRRVLARLRRRI